MVFVLVAGAATRGSKRWIDVGFFTFQPSEFGKVLFVLALAGFLAERSRSISEPARAARARSATALPPILLVFVQPDIGTALVYTAALAAVLFIAGIRWSHLARRSARSPCCRCAGRALAAARRRGERAEAVPDATA